MNFLLTQAKSKYTAKLNQFMVHPDSNPNMFKKTKLHYEVNLSSNNEIITFCKRGLNKMKKALDQNMASISNVEKLVIDFLPEYCFKEHTTSMSIY